MKKLFILTILLSTLAFAQTIDLTGDDVRHFGVYLGDSYYKVTVTNSELTKIEKNGEGEVLHTVHTTRRQAILFMIRYQMMDSDERMLYLTERFNIPREYLLRGG